MKLDKTYTATYAWVTHTSYPNLDGSPSPEPKLSDIKCGWCNKSQQDILNEHIEEHDKE